MERVILKSIAADGFRPIEEIETPMNPKFFSGFRIPTNTFKDEALVLHTPRAYNFKAIGAFITRSSEPAQVAKGKKAKGKK